MWFKKLFGKKELKLDTLVTNNNEFRVTQVEKLLKQKKTILCNGEEHEINWDQLVRFDQGGPGYESSHYKKRGKRTVKMLTAHWDACINTAQMIQVTKDRGLSVHFGIDVDGTIYQLLDTKDIAWHAKGINTFSIGVEIANPVKPKYNEWYKEKGLPLRPLVVGDIIHDSIVAPYLGFYPVQIKAFKELARTICKAHNIPLAAPLNENGKLVRGVDKRVAGRSFKGLVGHYHVTKEKTDPGNLPLDVIAKELKGEE